jgi:hypothetical protein
MIQLNINDFGELMKNIGVVIIFIISVFLVSGDIYKFCKDNMQYFVSGIPWSFIVIIPIILYFLLMTFLTVFISVFIITFYIVFISVFAIPSFSNYSISYSQQKMNEIKEACSNTKNVKSDTFCKKLGIWENFKNYLNIILDFWYNYLFHSAFIFIFLYNSANCMTDAIQSVSLKSVLHVINFTLVFIILLYTVFDYNMKATAKEEAKEYCPPGDDCDDNSYTKNTSSENLPPVRDQNLSKGEQVVLLQPADKNNIVSPSSGDVSTKQVADEISSKGEQVLPATSNETIIHPINNIQKNDSNNIPI